MTPHHIAILGRQPEISLAELEAVFGPQAVTRFSAVSALVATPSLSINTLGGTTKAGVVLFTTTLKDWTTLNKDIVHHFEEEWHAIDHKITLGISAYGLHVTPRQLQGMGLALKKYVKTRGGSLRLIPNTEPVLSTATSHHNKLGLSSSKLELLIVANQHTKKVTVALSTGAQNITALAKRDQARPRTDAFVGMLPPKLALMMINLALGQGLSVSKKVTSQTIILDPFCGTGTVLQEAVLRGFTPYGTDLSEKMVRYSRENLEWLYGSLHRTPNYTVEEGDAMNATWRQPIGAVVCETYLGQPFSAPPRPEKLKQVVGNCNHIVTQFLQNIHPQLAAGTPLCIAVPAWRSSDDSFTHLPVAHVKKLETLGFHTTTKNLLYHRQGQVVAREILSLTAVE